VPATSPLCHRPDTRRPSRLPPAFVALLLPARAAPRCRPPFNGMKDAQMTVLPAPELRAAAHGDPPPPQREACSSRRRSSSGSRAGASLLPAGPAASGARPRHGARRPPRRPDAQRFHGFSHPRVAARQRRERQERRPSTLFGHGSNFQNTPPNCMFRGVRVRDRAAQRAPPRPIVLVSLSCQQGPGLQLSRGLYPQTRHDPGLLEEGRLESRSESSQGSVKTRGSRTQAKRDNRDKPR